MTCDAHLQTCPSYFRQKSCVKIWFRLVETFKSYRGKRQKNGKITDATKKKKKKKKKYDGKKTEEPKADYSPSTPNKKALAPILNFLQLCSLYNHSGKFIP